jgi:sulfate adenylyltransferase large subunit
MAATIDRLPAGTAVATPARLPEDAGRGLLRFITCGSVDDGKSTLIGRLLYESQLLLDDQLAALEADSRRFGTQGEKLDLALLVDGLAAEREQGITIDVAYRYFATQGRSFIVADTPGHEQYTRNMATGASTADLAVILVDARKGILPQTRRHSLIVSMLGVKSVVVAVNKMDLVEWSPFVFSRIEREFGEIATRLGIQDVVCIPISALDGDNVVAKSERSPWYRGPTLVAHLETVDTSPRGGAHPFRMPVQWVNRPDADFRGYSGLIASGRIAPGDRVQVGPGQREAIIERIVTFDGDLAEAVEGQSVTLTLDREIDVSRGDVVASAVSPVPTARSIRSRVLWMSADPLQPGGPYLVKLGTQTVPATLAAPSAVLDIHSFEEAPGDTLPMNGIGRVAITFDRPVPYETYARNKDLGGFIVINRLTNEVVGLGLVEAGETEQREAPTETALKRWWSNPRESVSRSAAKALSWRVVGSAVTFGLVWALSGNLGLAALVLAAEVAIKAALGFGHERIWARSRYGLPEERDPALVSGGEGI